MFHTRRLEKQCFCYRMPFVTASGKQQLPDGFGARASARFAREQAFFTCFDERLPQAILNLRGFAAAFTAFKAL